MNIAMNVPSPRSSAGSSLEPAALLERLERAWKARQTSPGAVFAPRDFSPPSPVSPPSPLVTLYRAPCAFPRRAVELVESTGLRGPALEKARELLPLFLAGDALVILCGDHGRGKTCLAAWLAAERLKRLPECRRRPERAGLYVKFPDLYTRLKDAWKTPGETEAAITRPLRRAPFLVLDECHLSAPGCAGPDGRALSALIDARYDARLATLLILNRREEELEAALSRGILDRANETGGVVACDWESYRERA